jgi:hypothetical protein
MEPEGSVLCSQKLDCSPCHAIDEFSPQFLHCLLESHFNIILSSCHFVSFFPCYSGIWVQCIKLICLSTGYTQHKGKMQPYGPPYGRGSIIGIHLDMWKGTLQFYLNRKPLGKLEV